MILDFYKYKTFTYYNEKGFSGLGNLGKTCYMNSVLQCISNVLPFTHFILIENKGKGNELLQSYTTLLIELWRTNSPLYPKSFKIQFDICTKNKYSFNKEYDAQEFLLDFLDNIKIPLIDNVDEKESKSDSNKNKHICESKSVWNNHFKNSVISQVFYGQFMKKLSCINCNNDIRSFDPFITLNLRFEDNVDYDSSNISNLLDNYFKNEIIDLYCKCQGGNSKYVDNTCILKLPQNLLISLNRFKYNDHNTTKDYTEIELEYTLDMSNYSSTFIEDSVIYTLNSIICHIGDINSGHYYALVYRNDKWFCFNDHHVTSFDITKLDKRSPYILFYSKK